MGLLNLFKRKEENLPPFDLSQIGVDMHSHLIPGIDDGSQGMEETLAMLTKFEHLGYNKIITTPHIMSGVYSNTPEIIKAGLIDVQQNAKELGLSIQVEAAAEYYFDDNFLEQVRNGNVLSFGDKYILIEFSFHNPPHFENQLFFDLQLASYKPILAHFERYIYYHGSVDKAEEFKNKGVNIQLNLNSLTGHYGPEVKKQAELLIDAKLVDFVGTDCHRIEHLVLLENHLHKPYFHKLLELNLKNKLLK